MQQQKQNTNHLNTLNIMKIYKYIYNVVISQNNKIIRNVIFRTNNGNRDLGDVAQDLTDRYCLGPEDGEIFIQFFAGGREVYGIYFEE